MKVPGKSLFGPQTDLEGLPDFSQEQENKAKSKRDLMWEQRMNAKKNLVNPPIQAQGSILDSMNPASRQGLTR